MKLILLIAILALSSCGQQTTGDAALGGTGPLNPQPVSADTEGKMNIICAAVNYKTTILENETRDFNFTYEQRACGAKTSTTTDITATVTDSRNQNGETIYTFLPQTGKSYAFKEIETSNSGIIRKICESFQNPGTPATNPFLTDTTGTKSLTWVLANSESCEASNDYYCLTLLYGSSDDGGQNFFRHTRETMKIKVMSGTNRGYYVMRTKTSQVGCDKKDDATFTTTLK